jgi:two-component system, LytTR family, response regulator
MSALTALVVDDEELARRALVEQLADEPDVAVVGECANGFEAVKKVAELRPDILFLDVQMPKLDGFEVLELLDARPAVIFVTAYDAHAIKAFEVNAVDYLLKPFSKERLRAALARAKERLGAPAREETGALAASARAPGEYLTRLALKEGSKVVVLPVERVDWIRAQDDYVLLRSAGKEHLKQMTLASLEAQLDPARFLRIHRSYLLNVDRLARLEPAVSGEKEAVLADGTRLPVSRAGAARLRELLR